MSMQMRTAITGISACLLAAAAAPLPAQTNGFVLHCLSARAAGQGCVTRARVDVPTNLFHDPASIVWFERPALEVNASAFTPSLTFKNAANPSTMKGAQHSYPMASLAYIGAKLAPRLSWALGIEPIGGFGSDFKLRNPTLGERLNYESFFAALKAGPVLAFELVPGFSVGGGVYATHAQITEFRMPFSMPPAAAKGVAALSQLDPQHYPSLFGGITELVAYGDSRDFAGWGIGGTAGLAFRTPSGFRLSASWSPKSSLALDGATATIDMSTQFEGLFAALVQERIANHGESPTVAQSTVAQLLGAAGLDLARNAVANYRAATELSTPQTAGIGIGFQPLPRLDVSVEGVWMDWSAAAAVMPFILTESDNPNVNLLVNADPANRSFTYPFPLHWKDSWTGKIGIQYDVASETVLRAGYLYGTDPVPDHTVFIAFPAISTQAITAGAGFRLGSLPLDVSFVHALETRLDGCADGHSIASEYSRSRSTLSQTVLTFGVVWPF